MSNNVSSEAARKGGFSVSINPRPCHSEEYPKGTCFAARSDVGIRIFSGRNLRKAQDLYVLETDCRASVSTGSQ